MILVLSEIHSLQNKLEEFVAKKAIVDYRITLKLDMRIVAYILCADETLRLDEAEFETVKFNYILSGDLSEDGFLESMFSSKDKVDFGLRRRLSNLLSPTCTKPINDVCPVVTFYSYKGGVGRSTALALFASYFATAYDKSIFIIDCDFEAPGFTNFYDLELEETKKNGLVEYLTNKLFLKEAHQLDSSYVFEVSNKFSGNGKLRILPAGNLSTDRAIGMDSHLSHYLEGLARLDINSTTTIEQHFTTLITEINSIYSPDLILFDSRTGFNDVFGMLAHEFSDIVLGFFSNNQQTSSGLYYFIYNMLAKCKLSKEFMIVNSIMSSHKQYKKFKDLVDLLVRDIASDSLGHVPVVQTSGLSRQGILETIGSPDEDPDDFVSFIADPSSDYKDLFEKLVKAIQYKKEQNATFEAKIEPDDGREVLADEFENSAIMLKKHVLSKLLHNYPEPYADHMVFDEEFFQNKFYIRKCMEDFFSFDKFLLLGGKGTGKTAFYKALRDETFQQRLVLKAQKTNKKLLFIDAISIKSDPIESRNKYLEISQFDQSQIVDPDFFYRRFWHVFIHQAIFSDSQVQYANVIPALPIMNDTETATRFKKIIFDDNTYGKIEADLFSFDRWLNSQDTDAFVSFDQLDFIVKPNWWSKAIAPLINMWRSNNFRRISGKLFLRSDLFAKTGNITNKESLRKQAINLEWSQDEVFAFFFKTVFGYNKTEFFKIMRLYCDYNDSLIDDLERRVSKKNNFNQVPLDKYLIKPLVVTFFGKNANINKSTNYGESYEWLYRNLKNADETISLRPFLDLIKYAINLSLGTKWDSEPDKPILPPKYFADAKARENAVHRHFLDLAQEEGNSALLVVFDHLRNKNIPSRFRKSTLKQKDFESLIELTIKENFDKLSNTTVDEIIDLLISNGIVFITYQGRGEKLYTFAFLYKYYLGLTGRIYN